MKNVILFLFFALSFSILSAQETSSKYLKDGVPVVNGKVIFSEEITTDVPVPASTLFELINKWAEENYPKSNDIKNRILVSNPESKEIAVLGGKDLVFKNQALSLDKAFMSYQLLFDIMDSKCLVTIRNIKYDYQDARDKEILLAEKMITDEVALNKEGSKLNRYYDKFRTHTIDSVNVIFEDIDVYLNGEKQRKQALKEGAVQRQSQSPAPAEIVTPVAPSVENSKSADLPYRPDYKQVEPDKIPGNIIKLLQNKALLLNGDKCRTITSGGLGTIAGKAVVFTFSEETPQTGVYTIAFYTAAYDDVLTLCDNKAGHTTEELRQKGFNVQSTPTSGNAVDGAWMIIECENVLSQSVEKGLNMPQNTKMNVGQILNVWIK